MITSEYTYSSRGTVLNIPSHNMPIQRRNDMESKKVTWLELFSDLLFVAAIATVTSVLIHVEDGEIPFSYILKFVLIFVPIW